MSNTVGYINGTPVTARGAEVRCGLRGLRCSLFHGATPLNGIPECLMPNAVGCIGFAGRIVYFFADGTCKDTLHCAGTWSLY